jgi:hypothetical protein
LLNLRRRPDRLEHFFRLQALHWPLPEVTVFPAVDGRTLPIPATFTEGPGAYGCRQSHVAILEQALTDNVQSLLVLEDDVTWGTDLRERLEAFLSEVPDDWEQLMLGGGHHRPPLRVSDKVYKVNCGHRTHAYAVRPSGMRWLLSLWRNCSVHIDWVMAAHHRTHRVYSPAPHWLFGQARGTSDISCRTTQEEWWNELNPTPNVYSHDGAAGDIVYHLVPIKQLGGGRLVLTPSTCAGTTWNREAAESLMPLLRQQLYIDSVEWKDSPEGKNLGKWRDHYRNGMNLCDMACSWLGLPHYPRREPWLSVFEARKVSRVVFNRAPRWRNDKVDWRRIWEKYHKQAVFLGHKDEHTEFELTVGPVDYYPTKNFLEAAEVIAGCELFCGNQSALGAIAEGLKKPMVQEILERRNWLSNTHFDRPDKWHVENNSVVLPTIF